MMQLILETEPSGDIKTNMSLEVDTTNGDSTELKNDLCASKEKTIINDIICNSVKNVTVLTKSEIQRELSDINADSEDLVNIKLRNKDNDNPTCGANIAAEENCLDLNISEKISKKTEIKNGLKNFVVEEMDVDPEPSSLNSLSNNISSSCEKSENVTNSDSQNELKDTLNDISVIPHHFENGPDNIILNGVSDIKDNIEPQKKTHVNTEYLANVVQPIIGNKGILINTSNLLSKDETQTTLSTAGEKDTSKTLNDLPCVENQPKRLEIMGGDTDEVIMKTSLIEEELCELDETKEVLRKENAPIEVGTEMKNSFVTSDELSLIQQEIETPNQVVSDETSSEILSISDKATSKDIAIIDDGKTSVDNVESLSAVSEDKTISIDQDSTSIRVEELNEVIRSDNEDVNKNGKNEVPKQEKIEISTKNIDSESSELLVSDEKVDAVGISENSPNSLNEIANDAVDEQTNNSSEVSFEIKSTNHTSKNGVVNDTEEKLVNNNMDSDVTKKLVVEIKSDVTLNEKEISNKNVNIPMDIDISEEIDATDANVSENKNIANDVIATNNDTDLNTTEQLEATSTDIIEKQSDIEKDNVTCNIIDGSDEIVNDMPMDVDAPETVNLTETLCENNSNDNIVNSNDNIVIDIVSLKKIGTEIIPLPEIPSTAVKVCENKRETEYVDLDKENDATEAPSHSPEITADKYINTKETECKTSKNIEVIDEDDINIIEDDEPSTSDNKENITDNKATKTLPGFCKLSNTLDILSEEEDEELSKEAPKTNSDTSDKQCISIDDDDDIMLIEEDSNHKQSDSDKPPEVTDVEPEKMPITPPVSETSEKEVIPIDITELSPKINEKVEESTTDIVEDSINSEEKIEKLLPDNFLTTFKIKLADMTRDDLEEFCIIKIVESVVDRSGLGEIKNKIKQMSRMLEEYRKKTLALTKQNRDLQVVLKTVQEEQKKRPVGIQPMKITRSVGMQVLMTDKMQARRQGPIPSQLSSRPVRTVQNRNATSNKPANIPVPRLVPANNSAAAKAANISPVKATSPNVQRTVLVQKAPEKRPPSRQQSSSSVTVDLTDDEPPAKIKAKNSPSAPVRLVPSQNLMPQQKVPQFGSPRKVYIPINNQQAQALRPGQAVIMKTIPAVSPVRPRAAGIPARFQAPPLKADKVLRHPAPLPDAIKQYTPSAWKPLPPAPDLKLSKVENGIVISWKIDGVPENSYETVVSYQLYAYQETTALPNTSLWKKIGDVKALPLPMACTLTQFMAGYKYYFAVRAVDIRSRLGPFSVPGSILLLSKV